MRRGRGWSLAAVVGLAVPVALGSVPAAAATAAKPYDLNGDGRPDLVVGAPSLDRGAIDATGGVVVVPASDQLYPSGARIITQSTSKVAGSSEANDEFGSAVASGDFDRDGYADLAVGVPRQDYRGRQDAGAVTILYGSRQGLTGARSQQLSEPAGRFQFARFGASLAAGDLNRDGYPDLAVGAVEDQRYPNRDDDFPASGSVTVLYGGPSGISTAGSRRLLGDRGATHDVLFGSSLAIADVDADGRDDLVVVSKGNGDRGDGDGYPGSLSYCAGTASGPTACRRLLHDEALQSASALAAGNVTGDARPELVVGVPVTDIDQDPGSVQLVRLSGSGSGTSATATRVDQEDAGLPGSGEESGDDFGASVALGNVDGDAYADLVVGAPGEAVGEEAAGRVFVIRGGAAGLASSGNTAYDQDTPGVPGGSEDGDRFGAAVTLLDRNDDGRADLTVGAPGEDDEGGRATTLPGSGTGFTTAGSRAFGLRDIDVNYDNRYAARFASVLGR